MSDHEHVLEKNNKVLLTLRSLFWLACLLQDLASKATILLKCLSCSVLCHKANNLICASLNPTTYRSHFSEQTQMLPLTQSVINKHKLGNLPSSQSIHLNTRTLVFKYQNAGEELLNEHAEHFEEKPVKLLWKRIKTTPISSPKVI